MKTKTRIFILVSDKESWDQTEASCLVNFAVDLPVLIIYSPDYPHDGRGLNSGKEFIASSLIDAFNIAREHSIKHRENMLMIRSGALMENKGIHSMISSLKTHDVVLGTMLDPQNKNIEYTRKVEAGFPIPKFAKGEAISGITDSWWIDGAVLGFSLKALLATGEFDNAVQEHFFMVDYSIRARWTQMKIAINHDAPVEYLNTKPFSSVFKDRENEIFHLGQHNFLRKHGGDILRTLRG
ncbi:MAG: hypothetical protein KAU20_01220 [Nanoarchaeota archaeon]|nr:hypothetical protein [Nanoarchaeota archaeon]